MMNSRVLLLVLVALFLASGVLRAEPVASPQEQLRSY
jgi:hypothetical protein